MFDKDGYRANVGIILCNEQKQVFWGKRVRENSWQFPQGGMKRKESPEEAMYRELYEEVGLLPDQVEILARTKDWLKYNVPEKWIKRTWRGIYRGQKQIWFLLKMVAPDSSIQLNVAERPEFDDWRWNPYFVALESVIEFKREVYQLALKELAVTLFSQEELAIMDKKGYE